MVNITEHIKNGLFLSVGLVFLPVYAPVKGCLKSIAWARREREQLPAVHNKTQLLGVHRVIALGVTGASLVAEGVRRFTAWITPQRAEIMLGIYIFIVGIDIFNGFIPPWVLGFPDERGSFKGLLIAMLPLCWALLRMTWRDTNYV